MVRHMRIAVIGSTGQLGSELMKVFADDDIVGLTHRDIEVTDQTAVHRILGNLDASVVINTAAYQRVDECEKNVERSFAVNVLGVGNVALACRENDAVLVHLSTDYVFDGEKHEPYTEKDIPNPVSVYGVSKLAGEHLVRSLLSKYYIIRTSGLYGAAGSISKGGNFVDTMLRLAREGMRIRVVNDQVLTPTYAVDLAHKIKELVQMDSFGLYHFTNSGCCSWYQFAKEIFRLSRVAANLEPTTSEEFGALARRPKYSVLGHCSLRRIELADFRPWDEALAEYLEERGLRLQ